MTLKIETYQRLDRFKAKLIGERENSNLSFDDAVNALLDIAEVRHS